MLRDHDYTMVENASLVSHDGVITNKLPCATPTKLLNFTIEQISVTPIVPKNETVGHSVIREAFRNTNIPSENSNVITDWWKMITKNRYQSILRRWIIYATSRNTDPYTM